MTEKYYYYGLVDKENNSYGFVEEGDSRITEDFIKITAEKWQSLLDEQSEGKEIVYYEGKIFTAEPNTYYVDDFSIFKKRSDEEFEDYKNKKEKDRINNLTMTALDFITGLNTLGLSLDTINEYLESNLELKMQLTYCQNVYCYVVKNLCPLTVGDFTLTEDIAEAMFLYKAGDISLDDVTSLIAGTA